MNHPDHTLPHAILRVSVDDPAAGDPAPLAAGSGISIRVGAVWGAIVIALGWVVLAFRSPATTYHLAPLLITVAPTWIIRRQGNVQARHTIRYVVLGAIVAALTTGLLAASGNLQGPTLAGSHGATAEAMLATGIGTALALTGVWSRNRSH